MPGSSGFAGTVEDSIRSALSVNPDVGVVQADRRAIEQELRQARALYLPSIDVRAAIGPEYSNSTGTRSRSSRPPGADGHAFLTRMESQLTLTQMLFDGFAAQGEEERQLARIDSAAYRVKEAAEFVALDAIEAHLDVLRHQQLVSQAQNNVNAHQRLLERVQEGAAGGGRSSVEVSEARSRLAAARDVLALATGDLREAEARYQRVTGTPPDQLALPIVPRHGLPEGPEAAAALAGAASPTVQIATADIEVAKADIKAARATNYPRLDLEMGTSANENLDGIKGGNVDAQALLVVRYNLFRGGADVAREREAFERLAEAHELLKQARLEAEQQARVAYSQLMTAAARADALREQRLASLATRDAYDDQFEIRQRSLLDLLDAENELYLADANLTSAEVAEDFAVYRILTVVGSLLPVLDIDKPKESINIWRRAPGARR